jgi:hypothetical protein
MSPPNPSPRTRVKGIELRPRTEYFLQAIEAVRQNKQRYAEAKAQAALRQKGAMPGFLNSFFTLHTHFVDPSEEASD